jgi:hypothetical protein
VALYEIGKLIRGGRLERDPSYFVDNIFTKLGAPGHTKLKIEDGNNTDAEHKLLLAAHGSSHPTHMATVISAHTVKVK